jgi:hypothetical protein
MSRGSSSRGFSSRLLTQDSSGVATCPMDLYGLWAIKVNKYPPEHSHHDLPLGCARIFQDVT